MKTVVIDRAKWAIPRQTNSPSLLDADEATRCCLGFLGKACGIQDEELRHVSYPRQVNSPLWPRRLFERTPVWQGNDWEAVLSNINDAEGVDDMTREDWVREGFRRILRRHVRFVGKYAVPEPKP